MVIQSPKFSFVQFGETDFVDQNCMFDFSLCLPIVTPTDVAFQFYIALDDEVEADAFQADPSVLELLMENDTFVGGELLIPGTPEIFKINPITFLVNVALSWTGVTVLEDGQCFNLIARIGVYEARTNCFQKINEDGEADCDTALIEYGNEEDGFGFKYCLGEGDLIIDEPGGATCEPTLITFTNKSILTIPYTSTLISKHGLIPTVQVWIYDDNGDLVNMNIRAAFDSMPPTLLKFDFGGTASGIIKIK